MNWDCYSTKHIGYNSGIPMIARIRRRLSMIVEELGFVKKVDESSNEGKVKVLHRCASSSCFDKYNICCKDCDIKKCRYKCNYLDKEVCEHQFI